MNVLIAPDSFKGSLSATEVARAMAKGIRAVSPETELIEVPIADGGEGTVEAFVRACSGTLRHATVQGPLGEPVTATWGLLPDNTAVIEIAAAVGLMLLAPDKRDPNHAGTEGVGQLLRAVLDADVRRVIIGLGGSATNDGGSGMLRTLGARFLDCDGIDLPPGVLAFTRLEQIDITNLDPRLKDLDILVASDVDNPLCGPSGCSVVFGPQKGMQREDVPYMDAALAQYAHVAFKTTGRDAALQPGAGAAGGLGAALLYFTGAQIRPGIEIVLESVRFDELLVRADLVLTGEGRTDSQTLRGKVPLGVAHRAREHGVPVVCISGSLDKGAEKLYQEGVTALFACPPGPISLSESIAQAESLVCEATERAFRLIRLGMNLMQQ
ncbi:MAG: glycerate kinase [Deltaproteobacteria bacterium]|nr:glycerate kinase [Deltaproteobacteria bacterium]